MKRIPSIDDSFRLSLVCWPSLEQFSAIDAHPDDPVRVVQVGIPVFVTGGIGGVHRGAESSKYSCLLPPLRSPRIQQSQACLWSFLNSDTYVDGAGTPVPLATTGAIKRIRCSFDRIAHPRTGMDVSSDLTELGRTPVAVVCAGVKSILDIPRTLEYLVSWRTEWLQRSLSIASEPASTRGNFRRRKLRVV